MRTADGSAERNSAGKSALASAQKQIDAVIAGGAQAIAIRQDMEVDEDMKSLACKSSCPRSSRNT